MSSKDETLLCDVARVLGGLNAELTARSQSYRRLVHAEAAELEKGISGARERLAEYSGQLDALVWSRALVIRAIERHDDQGRTV